MSVPVSHPTQGPPVPPAKPVLSSPGSYMSAYNNGASTPTGIGGGSSAVPATAGIHSVNKSHEKPAIAARPIPPPTLPKYSSSFTKSDRDRNEFASKLDRGERDKNNATPSTSAVKSENSTSAAVKSEKSSSAPVTANNHSSVASPSSAATVSAVTGVMSNLNLKHDSQPSTNGTSAASNGASAALASSSTAAKVAVLNNHHSNHNSHSNNQTVTDSNKLHSDRAAAGDYHAREKPTVAAPVAPVRPKVKEIDGYVGFASLPDQVYRKAVKKGFEFTLMVVGESGLGKSTLINSMFLSDIYNQEQYPGPSQRIKKTVAVETTKVVLKENGVNLTLTVVDTPGYGVAVDNSNCWVPIIEFVESKYEEYLTAESRVHRKALCDNRVHTCLYFIAPTGHGLKPLDVEFMQRLCDKVNIIPVIAKADTMTPDEIQRFKKQILNEIAQHKIKIYDFPEPLEDEDEAKVLRALRSRVPFAVVGANTVVEIEGRKVRGRHYPWGVAEVENLEHNDFIALRNIVIRTHLQDLKDVTNNVHYENYRCRKLAGLGVDGKQSRLSNKNPLAQMEEEKREHELKMKKMEAEMEQVFEMKVKEKKQKLKDSEMELTRRHEERKKALEQSIRELEDRKRAFDQERQDWENSNGVTMDELRRKSLEASSKEIVDGKEKKEKKKKGLF